MKEDCHRAGPGSNNGRSYGNHRIASSKGAGAHDFIEFSSGRERSTGLVQHNTSNFSRCLWSRLAKHWCRHVSRATGEFLTSDAPVVRRDPGFRGGLHGGGMASSTAQVWFPLSKHACLLITHDNDRKRKYFELLEGGKVEEAEAIRANLPEISGRGIGAEYVQAVNGQTILNADRFVFSPF